MARTCVRRHRCCLPSCSLYLLKEIKRQTYRKIIRFLKRYHLELEVQNAKIRHHCIVQNSLLALSSGIKDAPASQVKRDSFQMLSHGVNILVRSKHPPSVWQPSAIRDHDTSAVQPLVREQWWKTSVEFAGELAEYLLRAR